MNRVSVLYRCGHWASARVAYARASACPRCAETIVERVNTHVWRVRCWTCRYSRWYGQDKSEAQLAVAQHFRLHPDHDPSLAYDRITDDGQGSILRSDSRDGRRAGRPPKPDTIPGLTTGQDAIELDPRSGTAEPPPF